jgi:hypothetical protein
MRGLIQSLTPLKPKLILLAVDGPKSHRPNDADLVRQTQDLVDEITWDAEIRTRFRDSNLGLRRAVVDAVTWANSEYGRVIVLEDDVRAGPQLLEFLNHGLTTYGEHTKIAHINGYNLVPEEHLTFPDRASRLSIYPESYAWATWDRAWQQYDDELTWAKNATVRDIKKICGSTVGALRWKQNFSDASAERIDTWAYRWLASMWEHQWLTVSPNRNIASYEGWAGGTHTYLRKSHSELAIETISQIELEDQTLEEDFKSDSWLSSDVFGENYLDLLGGQIVSLLLGMRKTFIRKALHE